MLRTSAIATIVCGVLGCHVGPSTSTFGPATGPRGIAADLRLKHGAVQGELLEVQDSALLVLRDDRVVLVPLAAIRVGSFEKRGALIEGGHSSRSARSALRLQSRFPSGLTPELRARLLAAYGQTEPAAP
jgi:hypothetical protein